MNACTAFMGYSAGLYLHGGVSFSRDLVGGLFVFLIIFFLSGGAAILNNYQDRHIDSQMKRTCRRPIPLGLVSDDRVQLLALLQAVISLAGLAAVSTSLSACVLAITAVLLYNGLYTPLKRKTLLAFIPGLLSGSLPPVIGWTAADAPVSIPVLCYFIAASILWQIPHYWLLLLSDRGDNAERFLPTFYSYFTREKLAELTHIWIISYSCVILLIPLFLFKIPYSLISFATLLVIVTVYAVSLISISFYFLKKGRASTIRFAFLTFNVFSLLFFLFLSGYFYADTYLIQPRFS